LFSNRCVFLLAGLTIFFGKVEVGQEVKCFTAFMLLKLYAFITNEPYIFPFLFLTRAPFLRPVLQL
ncbi:hypothetical protein, partial [Chryseobacterium sp. SIMBA_038]|uniref:hypothetical protein n=1 Tax=Chryseobacterium sp. SIMBA_038 TaxID=3085780 RepID=UPI00397C1377